jgi:hypothetical protein
MGMAQCAFARLTYPRSKKSNPRPKNRTYIDGILLAEGSLS